jgi:hypothetical protein
MRCSWGIIGKARSAEIVVGGVIFSKSVIQAKNIHLPGDSPLWDLHNVFLSPNFARTADSEHTELNDLIISSLGQNLLGQVSEMEPQFDKTVGH